MSISPTMTTSPMIALRAAVPADDADVRRLALLDDSPVPRGRVLLALVDGEPLAALSVDDGRAVADPFRRTADLVELLRLRAALAA
jgi:hypothetical protein